MRRPTGRCADGGPNAGPRSQVPERLQIRHAVISSARSWMFALTLGLFCPTMAPVFLSLVCLRLWVWLSSFSLPIVTGRIPFIHSILIYIGDFFLNDDLWLCGPFLNCLFYLFLFIWRPKIKFRDFYSSHSYRYGSTLSCRYPRFSILRSSTMSCRNGSLETRHQAVFPAISKK